MTRETGDMPGPGAGSGPPARATALAIGDGREDWTLPEDVFLAAGCRLLRAESLSEAASHCAATSPDLVFMPLILDGVLTTDQLRDCLARRPAPVVVVVASNDQINAAAEAMRQGAHDCLFKPFSRNRLARTIEAALSQVRRTLPENGAGRARHQAADARAAHPQPMARTGPNAASPTLSSLPAPMTRLERLGLAERGFVAASAQMRAVLEKVLSVATSDAPVFLSGEVATGKTTLAEMVHELSHRATQAFVTLACGTLTAADFDSRMLAPGGPLARAAGGTLYLDEIADLPLEVQPRLLRLIEGMGPDASGQTAGKTIRIVASTSHDPLAVLRRGLVRPDLFYRLHVAPIQVPSLRQREGDPALIARARLAEVSEVEGRGFVGLSDGALAMIAAHSWPGNLRELINVIWTVVIMNQGPVVTGEMLPEDLRRGLESTVAGNGPGDGGPRAPTRDTRPAALRTRDDGLGGLVGKSLAEIERDVIEATIRAQGGSVPRAARVLGVSPSTLYRKRETWAKAAAIEPSKGG